MSQGLSDKPGQFAVVAIVDGRLTAGDPEARIVLFDHPGIRQRVAKRGFGDGKGKSVDR
jgi:hypothetical protein